MLQSLHTEFTDTMFFWRARTTPGTWTLHPLPDAHWDRTTMPQSLNDAEWRKRLMAALPSLTAGQKRVAEYVSAHPVDLAFLTTLELARRTEVSEASIIRFSRALGYGGYQALQQEIRDLVAQVFSPFQLLQLTTQNTSANSEDILSRVAEADIQSIRTSSELISRNDFDRAVNLLFDASSVLMLGTRGVHALAYYGSHFLNQIRPGVQLIDHVEDRMADQLVYAGPSTVVLVFLFARYSRRLTEAIRFLQSRGSRLVVVADSLLAPGAEHATVLLRVQPYVNGFFRSHVASLSLVNALILGVALRNPEQTQAQLEQLEQAMTEFRIHIQARTPGSDAIPELLLIDHEHLNGTANTEEE